MPDIYHILKQLGIDYEKYDHQAVFTVEEAQKYDRGIDAGKSKNLFFRNKKGNKHYLVIVESLKTIDLKKLAALLNENKIGFASPERLLKFLGLAPGSVSPFGLINDKNKSVQVVVDMELMRYEKLAFHPNVNTATLVISADDFKRFLAWAENSVTYVDLN